MLDTWDDVALEVLYGHVIDAIEGGDDPWPRTRRDMGPDEVHPREAYRIDARGRVRVTVPAVRDLAPGVWRPVFVRRAE